MKSITLKEVFVFKRVCLHFLLIFTYGSWKCEAKKTAQTSFTPLITKLEIRPKTLKEGDMITVICSVRNRTRVKAIGYLQHVPESDTKSDRRGNISKTWRWKLDASHNGVIVGCRAGDSQKIQRIAVLSRPHSLRLYPSDEVIVGDLLICTGEGNPRPTFQLGRLFKQTVSKTRMELSNMGAGFAIPPTLSGKLEVFVCIANNSMGTTSMRDKVKVNQRIYTGLTVNRSEINNRSFVNLTCFHTLSNHNFSSISITFSDGRQIMWMNDEFRGTIEDLNIEKQYNSSEKKLIVGVEATTSINGNVVCRVTSVNDFNLGIAEKEINVTWEPIIEPLQMYIADKSSMNPMEDDVLTVTCVVKVGDPCIKRKMKLEVFGMEYTHENEALREGFKYYTISATQTLKWQHDKQKVTCFYGDQNLTDVLRVQYKPRGLALFSDTIGPGEQLQCLAKGHPPPTIKMRVQGPGWGVIEEEGTFDLVVPHNIKPGNYNVTCAANNSIGYEVVFMSVKIKSESSLMSSLFTLGVALLSANLSIAIFSIVFLLIYHCRLQAALVTESPAGIDSKREVNDYSNVNRRSCLNRLPEDEYADLNEIISSEDQEVNDNSDVSNFSDLQHDVYADPDATYSGREPHEVYEVLHETFSPVNTSV